MGVTIHYKLGVNAPYIKRILDDCEAQARQAAEHGLPVEVRRFSDRKLFIDCGECETLAFEFMTPGEVEASRGSKIGGQAWSYEWAILTNDGKTELDPGYMIEKYPENECLYTAGFCKTQFAGAAQHVLVAELIRCVASRCYLAEVSDEADYYQSQDFFKAVDAIGEVGAMIGQLGDQFKVAGFDVICGSDEASNA